MTAHTLFCVGECLCLFLCVPCFTLCMFAADSHPGGLEHGAVQWHGVHLSLRRSLLCSSYDIRKLRALQFARGHLG